VSCGRLRPLLLLDHEKTKKKKKNEGLLPSVFCFCFGKAAKNLRSPLVFFFKGKLPENARQNLLITFLIACSKLEIMDRCLLVLSLNSKLAPD
jgi:hypothetical protein